MRRALLIGIDHYQLPGNDLSAAGADAKAMAEQLKKHEDSKPNYDCRVLIDKTEDGRQITRAVLREECTRLFSGKRDDVVLYFSGHGVINDNGGYLCSADAEPNDWGVPMDEITTMACKSQVGDILIILDCCHSGSFANPSLMTSTDSRDPLAMIRENMTIIAASQPLEQAVEVGGHGLFTSAVLDALNGGAADHMGWVTAPAIYAYVERRFGGWDQRPVYKSHATGVHCVRECAPLIERFKLHDLVKIFSTIDFKLQLDPEFEPEDEHGNMHEPVNEEKVKLAYLLKNYRDAGLIRPSIADEQLFWTARRSHTVELTPRGREYWWLVKEDKV